MKVERTHSYPVAAETLFKTLTDKSFFEARFAMSGIDDYHFEAFEPHGDEFVIRVVRDMALRHDNVPAFARRFMGKTYQLVQEFIWTKTDSQPYRARYRFALGNVPVDVSGVIELDEHDKKARQHICVQVNSNLPLIGGKIASLAGEKVDKGLDSDYRSTLRYLEERGLT